MVKTEVRTTEKEVIRVWQEQLLDSRTMLTEEGETLIIIYPGRPNDGHGADFRDAVITLGDQMLRGDIEVHVRSSDWLTHQHHRDPFYDTVILQVVMWHDTIPPPRHDGCRVPTLAINRYLRESPLKMVRSPDGWGRFPACRQDDSVTEEFLAQMGGARFLLKAQPFEVELRQIADGECLYQGIMEALGYSQNRAPFRELAQRVPLKALETVARRGLPAAERLLRIQSLLLGAAGLLFPACLRYRESAGVEWTALERWWCPEDFEPMSAHAWNLFRLRPQNSPFRRTAAMSHLIMRYQEGLVAGMFALVQEARDYRDIERGLIVSDGDNLTLLGKERAGEIIINVILPYVYAWSTINARTELVDKAFTLYRGYPRLGSNSIEKHMRSQLGLGNKRVGSAQCQQGLLHIYKSFCVEGSCSSCPLHS